jgi:acyl-coenzyme A thioesterase PaaI-like protein
MENKAFQDYYSEDFSFCYGCGTRNEFGHKLKTYWNGDNTISKFIPKSEHMALPGFVYGGLIASLIDCHSTGSGSAALFKQQKEKTENYPRCVTASLKVEYLLPTPMNCTIILDGEIVELTEKKVRILTNLSANGKICAKGDVLVVKVPENWKPK